MVISHIKLAFSVATITCLYVLAQATEIHTPTAQVGDMLPMTMFGLVLLISFLTSLFRAQSKGVADWRRAFVAAMHSTTFSLAIGMGLYFVIPPRERYAYAILCVTTLIAWGGEDIQNWIVKMLQLTVIARAQKMAAWLGGGSDVERNDD